MGTENDIPIPSPGEEIAEVMGLKIAIKNGELLSGATKRRCPSIAKVRALGYSPRVSLKEGLRKTVAWYMNDINIQHGMFPEGITQ